MKYNLHFKVEGAVLVTDKSTGNATNHRLHWEPDNGNEFINFLNFRQFINQNAVFSQNFKNYRQENKHFGLKFVYE